MKKLFFMMVAVAGLSLASCAGGDNAASVSSAASVEVPADAKTVDLKAFSVALPAPLEVSYQGEDMLNAQAEGPISFDITYNDMGPTVSQLKETATNFVNMKKNAGETVGEPEIDGNTMRLRSVKDGEVSLTFVKNFDGTKCVSGSLKCPEAKEADCKPVLEQILKSVKLK